MAPWAWLADPDGYSEHRGDPFGLLGAFAQGYGLDPAGAEDFVDAIYLTHVQALKFSRRHADAGEDPFIQMWRERGGDQRVGRDERWYTESRERLVAAVGRAPGV